MLNQTEIRRLLGLDFATRFKPLAITSLTNRGWAKKQLDRIDVPLSTISSGAIQSDTNALTLPTVIRNASKKVEYKMDAVTKSATNKVNSKVRTGITATASAKTMAKTKAKIKAHEVFASKKTLKIPEPVFSEPKATAPINIQDADYTIKEDYPHTYGFIDSVKNWLKINKKKNHAEIVHNSGTHIKIDEKGNVTMHIVGSFKQIIEKDYSLEVKGNFDHIVGKDEYHHIGGKLDEVFDGNHTTDVGGPRQENASTIGHN